MSTAFSDFEPLAERRRVERQRQERRRVMVAFGGASVVLIIIVMGGAAVAYNASSSGDASDSSASPSGGGTPHPGLRGVSKIIKTMCAQTDYRDTCEKSLAKAAANTSASSPKDVIRASVAVIGDAVRKAFDRSGEIVSDDPRVKAAVADCKEIYENARDDLAHTLGSIDAGGVDGITKSGYQLLVWLSAVIAHQETCIDGFPDGDLKEKVRDAMESGRELTSNALAIVGKASSYLAALNLPSAVASSHRQLISFSFDEDTPKRPKKVNPSSENDLPLWVNRQERRLLKGKFQNKLTPNVVVAKDSSGKFKTINDALAAMPKNYKGRYVIYVKEGVYEEYVTITKAMVNVTMYGDSAKKTIVTGNRNFVDGYTTYKTATFNAKGDGFIGIAMGSGTRPARRSTRRWRCWCSRTGPSSSTASWRGIRIRSMHTPRRSSTVTALSPAPSTLSSETRRQCSRTASLHSAARSTISRTSPRRRAAPTAARPRASYSSTAASPPSWRSRTSPPVSPCAATSPARGASTRARSSWTPTSPPSSTRPATYRGAATSVSRRCGTPSTATRGLAPPRTAASAGRGTRR
ncbi:hypothetical protein GUJ93_ZPchr0010g9082 [Zizania palustris]|uniref:Pectinesterase inhibitor domain-containing protein n=1 Tax=Zizania palustris TaxID=103762 RepID=A0A8J5WCR7_ZIZPA|nr:hypothetical protein GUJ93_ZPchr0010g9082 [Zizania palustris]